MKVILKLMLLTGCRGGEIVSITCKSVDFERRELHFASTKNGLPHIVYLSHQAIEVLRQVRRGNSNYLFRSPTTGGHVRQHSIVWQVSEYRDDLGVDHWDLSRH